jgi:hypothetical protein
MMYKGEEITVKGTPFPEEPQEGEQGQALEKGLIELGGVTKGPGGIQGEIHAPGHLGHRP